MTWCCPGPRGIRLTVQAAPNAKKSEIAGVQGDALRIRLQAQPIEGRANAALIRFLAEALRVPKSTISIAAGQTGKRKIVDVAAPGMTVEQVKRALGLPAGE